MIRRLSVVVLVCVAAVACSDTGEKVKSGDPKSDVVTAPKTTKKPSTTTTGVDRQDIQIVAKGYSEAAPDSIGNVYGSYGVLIKNPNPKGWIAGSVSLNIAFYDASGTVVKSATPTLAAILPDQTAAVGETTQFKGAIRMEVQARVGKWEETEEQTGGFVGENVNTREEQYLGLTTTAELRSTFSKDLKSPQAVAIYYDGSNNIIGGAYTYVDFVPAGGKVAVEIRALNKVAGVAKTEVYGVITSLSLLAG